MCKEEPPELNFFNGDLVSYFSVDHEKIHLTNYRKNKNAFQ